MAVRAEAKGIADADCGFAGCGGGVFMNNQGWECPRCIKINAPWVDQCNCPSEDLLTMQVDQLVDKDAEEYLRFLRKKKQDNCSHIWVLSIAQQCNICDKCGVRATDVPISGGWL